MTTGLLDPPPPPPEEDGKVAEPLEPVLTGAYEDEEEGSEEEPLDEDPVTGAPLEPPEPGLEPEPG